MTDQPTPYTEITVASWPELCEQLDALGEDWIFRGQRDSTWDLKTTFERALAGSGMDPYDAEDWLCKSFRDEAHLFLPAAEIPQTNLECLAIMQHHRGATRLLDWTESPYVAGYFALEDAKEIPSAVWAVNISSLAIETERRLRTTKIDRNDSVLGDIDGMPKPSWAGGGNLYDWLSRTDMDDRVEIPPLVVPTRASRRSERQVIQKGLFMYQGTLRKSFEENLFSMAIDESRRCFRKIDVDPCLFPEALYRLERMNITRRSLFPGLDGFAQGQKIALKYPEGKTIAGLTDLHERILKGITKRALCSEDED